MKKFDICMVVHNNMTHDSRVHKEAASLSAVGWRVVVVGVSLNNDLLAEQEENPAGYFLVRVIPKFLRKTLPGKTGKRLRILISLFTIPVVLRRLNARVYHGHDFMGLLSIAMAGIWQRPVIYDSHELFFDRRVRGQIRLNDLMQLLRPLEKLLARRAQTVITVNDSIADRLKQTLRIARPTVLKNAVDLRTPGKLAALFPVEDRQLIVHTGVLSHGRHLDQLVEALAYLPDNIGLVLLGSGPLETHLRTLSVKLGVSNRLFVIPLVPMDSVVPTLSQGQVSAVLTSPNITNNYYALPNKFFEAVAAGIPIIASPIPEVTKLLEQYELGLSCEPNDAQSIARTVKDILEPNTLAKYRKNALRAREELNWEIEERKLVMLYHHILDKPLS